MGRQLVCYITLNASKAEEMIIIRKRSQNHPPLNFMEKELQPTDSITLLGFTITKILSLSQHFTCIAKKRLYILGRSRNLLPHQARINIYKAYIRPLIEYASLIWNGAGTTSLKLLYRLQEKALRLLKIDEHPYCVLLLGQKQSYISAHTYLGRVDCGTSSQHPLSLPLQTYDCIQDRCEGFSYGSHV